MEKSIKYTFFYLLKTQEIYAYSDDKQLIKRFYKTRQMERFYVKELRLTSQELELLHEEESGKRLLLYHFPITEDYELNLPITFLEKITVENIGNRIAFIDIVACATIPMQVFSKELQEALTTLQYDDAHRAWSHGELGTFQPDLFIVFMKNYGELMKLDLGRIKS